MVAVVLYGHYAAQIAALIVVSVTAVIGLAGLVAPPVVRPVYVVWMALAFPIGWTVSHLMMAVVFYLVVTPIGIIMRMCGRDPMRRRIDRSAKSYWVRRPSTTNIKHYFRQF